MDCFVCCWPRIFSRDSLLCKSIDRLCQKNTSKVASSRYTRGARCNQMNTPFCYLPGTGSAFQCARCLKPAQGPLTKDHVVPDWLVKRLDYFGFSIVIPDNVQIVCSPCNAKKGGNIDYADPRVADFMELFAQQILKKCRKEI